MKPTDVLTLGDDMDPKERNEMQQEMLSELMMQAAEEKWPEFERVAKQVLKDAIRLTVGIPN
jgi:transcription elongation factor GreA-like protein